MSMRVSLQLKSLNYIQVAFQFDKDLKALIIRTYIFCYTNIGRVFTYFQDGYQRIVI